MDDITAQTSNLIRTTLQEPSFIFRRKVSYIIAVCGYKFAADLLGKTLQIEIQGGMMTVDESRRRTMGGTYMRLADELMTQEQRREVDRLLRKKATREKEAAKAAKLARKAANMKAKAQAQRQILEVVDPPAPEVVAQQPEPQKPKNGKAVKPVANKKHDFAASRQARFQTASAPDDLTDDLPPAVSSKLKQLQGAANVLRERVEQLESKPAGQQVGLEIARKLLASNESQIAALLAQHERSSEVAS